MTPEQATDLELRHSALNMALNHNSKETIGCAGPYPAGTDGAPANLVALQKDVTAAQVVTDAQVFLGFLRAGLTQPATSDKLQ